MKFNKRMILDILLSLAVLLALGISLNNKTPSQEEMRKIIYQEINKNPEIITDFIATHPEQFISAVESAQAILSSEARNESMIVLGGQYVANKPVVVEFFNFGCHVCGEALNRLEEFKKAGKVQFAIKHIHSERFPEATVLAQFFEALYVYDPDKAMIFLRLVFSKQDKITKVPVKELLKELFNEIGVSDSEELKLIDVIKDKKIYDRLASYREEAKSLGVTSTPSFVVKGKVYEGLPPKEIFKNIIDSI